MKKKRQTKKSISKICDKLWSKRILNAGRCERCGSVRNLQAAHIFSRSLRSVRWELDNGLCLCGGCHIFWAHKNPVEFTEFVKGKLKEERYENLRKKAKTIVDLTHEDILQIQQYLASFGGGINEYKKSV
jgi:5-methylcytosine-specific restriction endonuclease McrA